MDNPQQYVDENSFRWTVGGIVGLALAAFGVLWKRLNSIEEKQDSQTRDLGDKQDKGDDALWASFNLHVRDLQAFREKTLETFREVPTKDDLAAMEKRLMTAINTSTMIRR